jgi:hypothetical protein
MEGRGGEGRGGEGWGGEGRGLIGFEVNCFNYCVPHLKNLTDRK